jgi:hypothetical protein
MPQQHPAEPGYTSPLKWIRLGQYCALSGDTADAVHARRRKRQWIDGRHTKVDPGGNLWVNPDEVNKWVEGQQDQSQAQTSNARAA